MVFGNQLAVLAETFLSEIGTGGFKTIELQCTTCKISPKGQKKLKCQCHCLYNSNSW